jgi:hypothetical protein
MSGIIKMVHSIDDEDGPYKTVAEVAEYFEKSKDTIKRWGKRLGIPNHKMPLSEEAENPNSFVWLYTESDIRAFEEFSKTFNPKGGRPPKRK